MAGPGLLLLAVAVAVDVVALTVMLTASAAQPVSSQSQLLHDDERQLIPTPFASAGAAFGIGGLTGSHPPPPPPPKSSEHHVPADGAVAHEFLQAHNSLRAKYGVPPLRWSNKLARYARRWSAARRSDCVMMHSPPGYGENVWKISGHDWRAAAVVADWAGEAADYDWAAQACRPGKECGHFTQMVWNDTELVGCGGSKCVADYVIVTCSYDPPGNWRGEKPLD